MLYNELSDFMVSLCVLNLSFHCGRLGFIHDNGYPKKSIFSLPNILQFEIQDNLLTRSTFDVKNNFCPFIEDSRAFLQDFYTVVCFKLTFLIGAAERVV